ncbi:hypothetical protein PUNSTDRAFT_94301 [Punctularia strigosozonata HHB-11173 SS5]|uniref:uncharacterized protein n=1 Tax=Punctularia strigosozonata (strain HHB-11173) TaxID=741275 RepID=UPI0004416AC4|nr:uncharacterized protein PUNSTDRAFT_94301 [Punctularia strigosozonata HHB-11173 SS5]EIN13287.1 hypothetical protein PUNSTDRAFT_94301 [Punctularia strigosozonata HHB-11173 SS5]
MAKRKQKTQDEVDGDDSDVSLVDVDFEFFDPNPKVDYIALKRLIVQQFQSDAEALQVNDLADLILSQPLVGTTIKCDGIESDPYAVLTVLNMHVHQARPSIRAIRDYALAKSGANPAFHQALQGLLGESGLQSQNHVGLVFSERLINMPVQTVPPMYRMLENEIKWAIDDNEPYRFTHLMFISRIYKLTDAEAAELHADQPRSKKHKNAAAAQASSTAKGGSYSFHPEDEIIQKFATHAIDYSFTNAQPRDEEAFGLDTGGRMMLVPSDRFQELIAAINREYAVPP